MTLVREPITGLWHDDTIRYPIGYGTELVSLDNLIRRELSGTCLPEYRLRLVNVIIWHQGNMGIGDAWRPTPSNTSPASMRGESFHQDQVYNDKRVWFSGADMVCRNPLGPTHKHVAPPTHDLPVQGTEAAIMYGIHANVGTPGQGGWESWHAQCVEQDGWLTWVIQGRLYPSNLYPFPVLHPAPKPPTPLPNPIPDPTPGADMQLIIKPANNDQGQQWWPASYPVQGGVQAVDPCWFIYENGIVTRAIGATVDQAIADGFPTRFVKGVSHYKELIRLAGTRKEDCPEGIWW